jgi:NADH dehydrogenase
MSYAVAIAAIAVAVLLGLLSLSRRARPYVTAPADGHGTGGGPRPKRVVVLGGGFAGVYAAHHLEEALRGRDDYEVVLVNKENYFVFQPMLPEVISGSIGITDTVSPIRRLLPRSALHVREIESVDLAKKTVTLAPGFQPHAHTLPYDHLVVALGNVTDFRGLAGLPEHALPFKNLADAIHLRNHVIRVLEEAAIEEHDAELRRELLTFVVAGGGFSGVEVVAELNDFVRAVAKHYRGIDPAEIRVILLHGQDRILPEMAASLALFAQKILARRGVDIRFHTRLAAATGRSAVLAGGAQIPTRTLVSTVPASPHPIVDALALPKAKGKIKTDRFLEVEGTPGVWAVGDCALVPMADGSPCPPTAQHAVRAAKTAAANIVAAIRGGEKKPFDFAGLGKMGSLGHRSAVAEVFGLKIKGFLAWWLWRTIYLMKLPGWGRRLKVASSWTLDLFLPPELVQLRLSGTNGVAREHFEPGQEVFREGDVGDRIYIVLSGEVDVLQARDGRDVVLARLGAGECFGEMALLNKTTRNATIRCATAMDAVSLPKREFGLLATNLPEMRQAFEKVMARRGVRAAAPAAAS